MRQHDAPDVHEALDELPGLTADDRSRLWSLGRVVTVPVGWSPIHQAEPPDMVYLLLEGAVEVRRDGEHLADVGPGGLVGEIAPVAHLLRTATVTARVPLLTLAFPAADFARLREELPRFDAAVASVATARLQELHSAGGEATGP